jgi:hypothetical protein
MTKLTALLISIAIPFALAACGGDDDEGPSKEEFVKEANAVCTRAEAEAEQVGEGAFKNPEKPTAKEAQAALVELLPLARQQQLDLEKIEKPKDDEDEIEKLLAAYDAGNTQIAEATKSPEESLIAIASIDKIYAEADKLASAYGLEECAGDA